MRARGRKPAAGYRRLTGADEFFVRQDRGSTYNHTLKLSFLDPSTDPDGWSFDVYREMIKSHLSVASVLTRRYLPTPLGIHHPVWVDDPQFDLDSHLRRVACPAPGGMREFCKLVEQIYSHPLDHGRPLWQMWAVEGLADGRVALLALLHHAYTDGAGIRGIFEEVTLAEPTDSSSDRVPAREPAPLPSARRRLVWALRDLPQLARAVPAAAVAVRERRRLEREFRSESVTDRPSGADRRAPQPFGGPLVRSRRFSCDTFTIAEIQEVRRALGGTINDIFLTCAAGSLRSFLLKRDRPCDSPIIGTMGFLAKPVEQRSAQGGNFSGASYLWLHVEIADPVQRLAATSASATAAKDHIRATADADPLLVLSDLIPGGLMRGLARFDERTEGRYTPGSNVVVSNASGARERRYVGRWLIDSWFSTGQVLHGATLNLTGWSYADQFNVCVLAGSADVTDAWELTEGYRAAFDELVALARVAQGNPQATPVART